jgi:tetratricopeptide (TPR) repeat protein
LALSDLAEAEANYREGLRQSIESKDQNQEGIFSNQLGRALQAKGDLDGALQYAQRALTIDEKVYGPSHPTDVNNIGQILQAKAIWTALCVTPKGLNNL